MKALLCLLCLCLVSSTTLAQRKLGEAAKIVGVELQGEPMPGGKVIAVVKVRVDEGYHLQSHKPSEPQFIATVVTVDAAAGARVGTISYPAGKSEKVEGLSKPLSVYEGEFTVSIPIGLTAAAKLPLTLPTTLAYQACKGAQCYAPQKLKFDIKIEPKK